MGSETKDKLKNTVDSVQAKLRRLEMENKDLKEKMSKNERLRTEINELSQTNEGLVEEIKRYKEDEIAWKGEIEGYKVSTSEFEAIIKNLRGEIEANKLSKSDLLEKIEGYKGLEGINKEIQIKLEDAKRTITALNKRMLSHSKSEQIIDALKEENNAIKEGLEMKRKSSKGMVDNLNEKINAIKKRKGKVRNCKP